MPLNKQPNVTTFIQSREGNDAQANGAFPQRRLNQELPQQSAVRPQKRGDQARTGYGNTGLARQAAEGLKVTLPHTTTNLPRKSISPNIDGPLDIAGLATKQQPLGNFDDTASHLTLDSESTDDDDQPRECYAAFGDSDYNRHPRSNPNLKHVSPSLAMQMRGEIIPDDENQGPGYNINIGPNWRAQVTEQKAHMGFHGGQTSVQNNAFYDHGNYDQQDYNENHRVDEYDDQQLPIEPDQEIDTGTPTRSKTITANAEYPYQASSTAGKPFVSAANTGKPYSAPATTRNAFPIATNLKKPTSVAEAGSVKSTAATTNMGPPPPKNTGNIATAIQKQNHQLTMPQVPAKTTHFNPSPDIAQDTKASSYNGSSSSEDDFPITKRSNSNRNGKRPLSDTFDYSIDAMKKMSYTDLDKSVSFLTDPSLPPTPAIVDAHGQPLTTAQRLENMAKMKEEDIMVMFKSFDDNQNEETAEWFQKMMFEDMKALMAAKLESRKLTYKYEFMAKQREAEVRAKMDDVDTESGRLKGGLANLMQSKDLVKMKDQKHQTDSDVKN